MYRLGYTFFVCFSNLFIYWCVDKDCPYFFIFYFKMMSRDYKKTDDETMQLLK